MWHLVPQRVVGAGLFVSCNPSRRSVEGGYEECQLSGSDEDHQNVDM